MPHSTKKLTEIEINKRLNSINKKFKGKLKILKVYGSVIKVKCLEHNIVKEQSIIEILKSKYCCRKGYQPFITNNRKLTHGEFINKMNLRHGDKYRILEKYKKNLIKHKFKCNICKNVWHTCPSNILAGHGCPKCGIKNNRERNRMSHDEYSSIVKRYSNNTIIVIETYEWNNIAINHKCTICNFVFKRKPNYTCSDKTIRCPFCNKKGYSSIAIKWLELEERKRRIKIHHMEKGYEITIPGTKFRVDGINFRKKIIFEFYGNVFHGNLKIYKPRSTPHPFSNKTAKMLYKETKLREEKLKSLGYTVISIWEEDFRKILNKEIKWSKLGNYYESL